MLLQTLQGLASGRMQIVFVQFDFGLPRQGGDVLTQRLVRPGERGRVVAHGPPGVVGAIQRPDPLDPAQGPASQRRPGASRLQEVAADVRPAKGQDDPALLHLRQRLVGRVAIHHQDAFRLRTQVFLRHVVGAAVGQHEHHHVG